MNKLLNWKSALIVGSTLLGLIALYPPEKKLKLGIDLSGGTILVYEVAKESASAKNFNMQELIAALKQRADPQGVKETPIRSVGGNRIEIILPKASPEEVEEVKSMLTDVGSLEFRILANRKHDSEATSRALGPGGLAKPPARYKWARLGEVSSGTNPQFTEKSITDAKQNWKRDLYAGVEVVVSGKDSTGAEKRLAIPIERNSADTLTLTEPHNLASIASYEVAYNPSQIRGGDPTRPMPSDPIIREEKVSEGRTEIYILCVEDRQDVTGKFLSRAYAAQDERLQPAVGFQFNRTGARKFGQLTREHLPEEGDAFRYQLAILLDNLVMSAPSINSEIRDSGIIEGGGQGFKAKEVDHLINILQAGSLPASLNPTPLQEENVGPTLGEDSIAKGWRAIWVSMLIVPIFMIWYYRFAGVVAVIALIANMILLIGSMAFIQATFSLPGLAGLALTIGMAVDANVLVFERMREEKEKGASLSQQIRNGFNRAWVTIFDSHVTNLLAAIVLYAVGTEEVKGFALTMILGMLWNLFTAVFMSRFIFEAAYSQGWLKELHFRKLWDKTNIDFVGPRYYCMAVSMILILLGLAAFFARGRTMYNIDFTGGTLVTIRLNEADATVKSLSDSQRTEFVREKAGVLPDVTIESLRVSHEGAEKAARFNIRTTDQDPVQVKNKIIEAFGPSLAKIDMTVGAEKAIAGAPADAKSTTPSLAARFAGGREYELSFNTTSFNSTQKPAEVVAAEFARVLDAAKIANPTSRFEIVPLGSADKAAVGGTKLLLRTDLEPDAAKTLLASLKDSLANNRDMLFERIANFGSTVASETRTLALIATVASWVIIVAYLWWRFHSFTYGLAAVLAVVHDVLITLGAIAVSYWLALIPGFNSLLMIDQFKIDLPIVAAFLTLIGFSVNDTIVIFDRIREIKGKTPHLTPKLVNDAINQTLSRTILTSLTAWLVVLVLYVLGGEGLHGFAFALVVGFLSGTYSTVYIATPILIDWIGHEEASPSAASKPGDKSAVASRLS
ncbi:protein translocase subunit SecD [Paludisphaera rhizosphaerae]|uniref:protein translocase subunit SecD n=1 Tax=Paludisphaera rhizosphaerae TaxID=2711216 RepID=UPI0013E9B003|nr:protein translocase subunit SecD [Paludisphaera rhizosphaerae]